MHQAAQAYGAVARQIANPRELEANLLLKAASRLQSIRDGWETKKDDLQEALAFNRKLWTIFSTSATQQDSPLPRELRQNIANLGLFVFNHTVTVMAEPRPEKLGTLININRELAAGLLARG
jgi:flagellar protein FlaF